MSKKLKLARPKKLSGDKPSDIDLIKLTSLNQITVYTTLGAMKMGYEYIGFYISNTGGITRIPKDSNFGDDIKMQLRKYLD